MLGELHVTMKAETEEMLLQAKERQRLPATHQKLVSGTEQILPHSPQKEPALPTP